MHISKVAIVNYRNFANTNFLFKSGINTIVGENGSGKSNLFRAIRLLLDDSMIASSHRLNTDDFHRGLTGWQGHWIIISAEFENVSPEEAIQALFLHGTGDVANETVEKGTYNLIFRPKKPIRIRLSQLPRGDRVALDAILAAISIDDYETIFTGRSSADFADPDFYRRVVGDFENVVFDNEVDFPEVGASIPNVLSISREVSFTFIQALRDVVAEFQNRTNPLRVLLKGKSGEIDPAEFKYISDKVRDLNESIDQWPDVKAISGDITETIKDAVGSTYSPSSLSIKSDLSDETDKLFQSLRLYVDETGDSRQGAIHELSLGGANLVYLTLKLLEFKYQKARMSFANFLLIEEPEAHIHAHIQKTLFDRINYLDTQIIYSTHSTQISDVSNVERMNILGRVEGKYQAFQPTTGLSTEEIRNIQRYLDAVRSNLLFARSVILVEGDAEEILIPIMVKQVFGVSLDELGISLVNIRSTGFDNVAVLFHDTRIRKKCSIITDLDAQLISERFIGVDGVTPPELASSPSRSESLGVSRREHLLGLANENPWLMPYFAPNTFEVEFVTAGNANTIVRILYDVYQDPVTIQRAKEEMESGVLEQYGSRVMTMSKKLGKGWFAIVLGKEINRDTRIPQYVLDAIAFCQPDLSKEIWVSIFSHRLNSLKETDRFDSEVHDHLTSMVENYKKGQIEFDQICDEMNARLSHDNIVDIIKGYQ